MSDDASESSLTEVARKKGLLPLLTSAIHRADAIATGALGTEPLQLLMIPGRLVQAARNRTFIEQLASELERLREKGRIQPDFERSEEAQSALQQLLAALEDPPVDSAKFEALKNIFVAAATGEAPKDVPPQLLLEVARGLGSGELIVLGTAYRIARTQAHGQGRGQESAHAWIQEIAEQSGLGLDGLVDGYADTLAARKLIFPRRYGDRSGMRMGSNFGLTDFGVALCEIIQRGAAVSEEGESAA